MNEQTPLLDIFYKLAMVIIGCTNAYIAYTLYKLKDKKDNIEKNKDRKFQFFKTFILDHNLKYLYSFFDNVEIKLRERQPEINEFSGKAGIDNDLQELFSTVRIQFTDLLLAIEDIGSDVSLYKNVLSKFDELQTKLSLSIFDTGLNLTDKAKFNSEIVKELSKTKTEIVKILYNHQNP
jgi:hypothetical protein